jgi:hypothetical protein
MNLDEEAKQCVSKLSEAISEAVEKSEPVSRAIKRLREIGYEPNLTLRLEIGLQEIGEESEDFPESIELDLTDEDLLALRRMKIRIE